MKRDIEIKNDIPNIFLASISTHWGYLLKFILDISKVIVFDNPDLTRWQRRIIRSNKNLIT